MYFNNNHDIIINLSIFIGVMYNLKSNSVVYCIFKRHLFYFIFLSLILINWNCFDMAFPLVLILYAMVPLGNIDHNVNP